MEEELKWQTRDEMSYPTNPLQKLYEALTSTSKDMSVDKLDAFMYGIIVGWDECYDELKIKHNWSDQDILLQKQWNQKYNELWNKFFQEK